MKLALPDVTLVAITTACHDMTLLAVDDCLKHAKFGDVKIFMDKQSPDIIEINPFNGPQDGIDFQYYRLPKYIKTSHILSIQWDSWIIDPAMWSDEFLKYDYIGAPWWYDDQWNVGNSGFCLKSKALMDFMLTHREDFPMSGAEDDLLCRHYQPHLPFKWAPTAVAHDFAFERTRASVYSKHFGFHGAFNWPAVMTPEALAERVSIAGNNEYIKQNEKLKEVNPLCQWRKLALN